MRVCGDSGGALSVPDWRVCTFCLLSVHVRTDRYGTERHVQAEGRKESNVRSDVEEVGGGGGEEER